MMIRRYLLGVLATVSVCRALDADDPTHIAFNVPREAVVMGQDIARTDWPVRLAKPSGEGQFEVLVRKTAAPVVAPGCHSAYLVVRMPASVLTSSHDLATQAAIRQKRSVFDRMLQDYDAGRPMRFDVFAGPYGHRGPNGKIVLTGCNLFFEEPTVPPP